MNPAIPLLFRNIIDSDQVNLTKNGNKRAVSAFVTPMSPPDPQMTATGADLRQTARRPRESDGVGNALRNIFAGAPNLPHDWTALLSRLNHNDNETA